MLEAFFEEIQSKRSEQLKNAGKQYPRNNPVASDISPCVRETALGVLHWQDRPPFSEDLLARFEVGNDQENLAMAKMLKLGIKVVEQQQNFELRDARGRLVLRGRIDGKAEVDGKRIPFDYKTVNPMVFERLSSVDDLLRHGFFSKYPKQLWAYEYMNNIDVGFIWMDNLMGRWKFIEVPMDWGAMENVLRQCEQAVESIEAVRAGKPEAEALPDYHRDPAVCLKCWAYGRVCNPPFFATGEGLKMINDPELEGKLKRLDEAYDTHREYETLDKELKEVFKNRTNLIIGDWLIRGEEKIRKQKAQVARESPYWRMTIEKLTEDEHEKD